MTRERKRPVVRDGFLGHSDLLVAEIVLNRRRRYVLYYLHEQSDPTPLKDVARQVAAWEDVTTPEEVARVRTRAVYASLRRSHIPYLEARGLVTYDAGSDRVTCRVDDPALEVFLANDYRTSVPWYLVYLALTVLSTVFLVLARSGVRPFSELRPVVVAAVIVVAFAVASVLHWYDVYRWRRRTENEPPDFLVSVEEDLTPPDEEDRENAGSGENGESGEDGESGGDGESIGENPETRDRP